jgi:hypothetical protein
MGFNRFPYPPRFRAPLLVWLQSPHQHYAEHEVAMMLEGPSDTPIPVTTAFVKNRRSRPISGLTLGGLIFTIYVFIFLRPAPKTPSTHERALEVVSGADFWCNLLHFWAGARPKAPGARRGPQGAENRQKNVAGFIILSSLN